MTKIKNRFGYYKPGREYWVYMDDIKIRPCFRKTRISDDKWRAKNHYFNQTGRFESKIILRKKDFLLLDGYSSFRIAEEHDLGKVPVYFEK